MNQEQILKLLQNVQRGTSSVEQAMEALRLMPGEFIKDACIDHHRSLRTGMPEVVFGEGKSAEQIITIAKTFLARNTLFFATRVDEGKAAAVCEKYPELHYHANARIVSSALPTPDPLQCRGNILILCAGTSDVPVAEEARITATALGQPVVTHYDVGVAGLHRLFSKQQEIYSASVIIVVAGMEGALPSVVSGVCSAPVIAVPTSIGYGTSFGGLTALFGMLNSCAPGLAVVNIDNGFGAACHAAAINRKNEPVSLQESGSTV